jgi:hypothetical protein
MLPSTYSQEEGKGASCTFSLPHQTFFPFPNSFSSIGAFYVPILVYLIYLFFVNCVSPLNNQKSLCNEKNLCSSTNKLVYVCYELGYVLVHTCTYSYLDMTSFSLKHSINATGVRFRLKPHLIDRSSA